MLKWTRGWLEFWQELYADRTEVLRDRNRLAEAEFGVRLREYEDAHPEPGPEPEKTWRDHLRAWLASDDAEHLAPRDIQAVEWAVERLQGRSKSAGTEAEARQVLTTSFVPKDCWPR